MAYTTTGLESQSGLKSQDCFIIFLHALNSGLLRVKLQGPTGRLVLPCNYLNIADDKTFDFVQCLADWEERDNLYGQFQMLKKFTLKFLTTYCNSYTGSPRYKR